MKKIRPLVFLPPFLLLLIAVLMNFVDKDAFTKTMTDANDGVLAVFGKVFAVAPLLMLATCIILFFSPFGRVIIGGPDAKPLLTRWRWFSFTLCTPTAIGILFWSTTEPMTLLCAPSKRRGLLPPRALAGALVLGPPCFHFTFTPHLFCF
ncbi:MAG: BCCT family transporter, partial [Verrucomicrobia bacterium]|nr:BCCT family transporter [Verrucomicrobiota bacterium]